MSRTDNTGDKRDGRTGPPRLSQGRCHWIKSNANDLAPLLELPETFDAGALPTHLQNRIPKLKQVEAIQVVEYRVKDGERRAVWSINDHVADAIAFWQEDVETWPCGHPAVGFRNPRGGEGYTCLNDECEVRFNRETLFDNLDT